MALLIKGCGQFQDLTKSLLRKNRAGTAVSRNTIFNQKNLPLKSRLRGFDADEIIL